MSLWRWDSVLASLLWLGLASVVFLQSHRPQDLARAAEPMTLATGLRVDLQEYYALHGEWPQTSEKIESGSFVKKIVVEQGIMDVTFKDDMKTFSGKHLLFRPAVSSQNATIILLCGNRVTPEGFTAPLVAESNVPSVALIEMCK